MNNDCQKKVFNIEDLKTVEEDGKTYLTGYANTKNKPDGYGDIPVNYNGKKLYDFSIFKKNPVCFVDHYASASNIAGNFAVYKEDDRGLYFKLLLRNLSDIHTDNVKDAVSAYMQGFGHALSIGGIWLHEDPKHPTHLTTAKIYEISLVGIGADPNALTDADYPKSINDSWSKHIQECEDMFEDTGSKTVPPLKDYPLADKEHAWDASAAVKRLRDYSGSTDNPSTKYKNGFMWYDATDIENYTAYKLPYVDVIDGKAMVVPRAIFAIRTVLKGGRKPLVGVSDGDKQKIKARVNHFYEKMGMEKPFTKDANYHNIDDVRDINTKKEFEEVLRESGAFSRNAATFLAAKFVESQSESEDSANEDCLKAMNDLINKLNGE